MEDCKFHHSTYGNIFYDEMWNPQFIWYLGLRIVELSTIWSHFKKVMRNHEIFGGPHYFQVNRSGKKHLLKWMSPWVQGCGSGQLGLGYWLEEICMALSGKSPEKESIHPSSSSPRNNACRNGCQFCWRNSYWIACKTSYTIFCDSNSE